MTVLALMVQTCILSQGMFTVTGQVNGIEKGTIHLIHIESKDTVATARIVHGKFQASGPWPDENIHVLPVTVVCTQKDKAKSVSAAFALEPYPLRIELGMNQLPVYSGSEFQKNFTALIKHTDILLRQLYDPVTGDIVASVRGQFGSILDVFYKEYEEDYYKGFLALMIADFVSRRMAHPNDFMRLRGACYEARYVDKYDTLICASFAAFRDNDLGQKPHQIAGQTYDGESFALEKLIGEKCVLLDFWASWSEPCVRDMPVLKEYYTKYDMEIVGISIDRTGDDWRKAMEKLKLPWINIHDLTGEIRKSYHITTVPSLIVINNNGVIIARNPDDLDATLKALRIERK
jgi:thiol-disulfide isomerase/thioredoxin